MTKKAAGNSMKGAAGASPAADPVRADVRSAEAPVPPLHPLMAHPTASVAAATAIGFGFASQMAGAFFGALQGAMEASGVLAKALAENAAEARNGAKAPAATKVATEPAAAPVAEPAPSAKAEKVAAPKPGAVKTSKPARTASKAAAARKPAAAPAKKADVKPKAGVKRSKSTTVDDLKAISGIGPKLEKVLNEMGYSRYADIAGWTAEDIGRIDGELGFGGRIGRDDWVGQAKALMKGNAAKS